MTWFRVDDGFYSHPKVLSIPRSIRAAAIGTWTLAGTYSADKETDGFVPTYIVEELGGTLEAAEALVAVGLWKTRRGKGFVFVNWKDFQYTRAQNEERREFERSRKARQRAAQQARDSGGTSEDVPVGQTAGPDYPSPSPSPSPKTKTDNTSSRSRSGGDDGVQPVDNSGDYAAALAHTAERFGVDLSVAGVIVDTIIGRAKNPPRMLVRFVKGSLTKQHHEWERYAHDPKPSNLPS